MSEPDNDLPPYNDPDANQPMDPDAFDPEADAPSRLDDDEELDALTPVDVGQLRLERRIEGRAARTTRGFDRELTWDGFKRICAILAETGVKYKAAEAGGFRYETVRQAIARNAAEGDNTWQELWDLSQEHYRESLASEARARAVDGWKEPVFNKDGVLKGYVRKKSDRLLELMLKAHHPDFQERKHHTLELQGGGFDVLKDLTLDAKRRVREIILEDLRAQGLLSVGQDVIEGEVLNG